MRRLLVTFVALAAFAASANAGFLLDFGDASSDPSLAAPQRWVPGDYSHTITAHDGSDTCEVTFQFNDDPANPLVGQDNDAGTISPGSSTPFVTSPILGGLSGFGGNEGLVWRMDADDPNDPAVSLTITFPQAVDNLSFEIGDIDTIAGPAGLRFWQDVVTVTGQDGSTASAYTATLPGSGNVASVGGGVFEAVAGSDVPDNQSTNNVGFNFTDPVQSVTILFEPGDDVTSSIQTQWISLSDLSFDKGVEAIPEPSAFACLGLVMVGAVGYRRRRLLK